ncbi:MAG: sugar phosphate nucleotidyltransferase [Thermoanaerobaculales bacterium]|nr:sugar phosphate nucleotidyltransferase [Thermoanaerobaculales bacterium]
MIEVAMVLAAGRGERMRPLSDVLPKPALPLPDGPVVASAIRLAAAGGARRVVVNTWHLAHTMEQRLQGVAAPPIQISREPERMGTSGGIALARDRGLLGDRGPVLIINGDGLLNLDLEPLLHHMTTGGDLVSLALLPHLDPLSWSRVLLGHDGTIRGFRPPGTPDPGEVPFLFPGVMLVSREALDTLPSRPGETPEDLWGPAMACGRLSGVPVSGHWREVGNPTAYLEAVLSRLRGKGVIHPSSEVHPTAAIGAAYVGPDARVEAGAVVGESVISEGAVVGESARVLRSVLLGRVTADAGEKVVDHFLAKPL